MGKIIYQINLIKNLQLSECRNNLLSSIFYLNRIISYVEIRITFLINSSLMGDLINLIVR